MSQKKTKLIDKVGNASVEFVEADLIIPSPDNPRIINENSQNFIDLVDSIRASGVLIPIHVRHHPKKKSNYDLLAGERRLVAVRLCQQKTIPAIVHDGMSDEQAFELTFAENFAREDLTVMEQGKAVATLMQKYKNDREAVASKMGKSIQWVSQRIALVKNLSKEWQQALTETEQDMQIPHWPVSHLQRIAVFPAEVQDQILDDFAYNEIPTTKELDEFLCSQLMVLSKAPWDLTNTKLIESAKACSKCPKRSSAQPGLWDDTLDVKELKKNDRCLDRRCWQEKLDAFVEAKALELRQKYPNLVAAVMPDQKINYRDEVVLRNKFGHVAFQWESAKEGEKDALPALMVFGNEAGNLRFIKIPAQKAESSTGRKRPLGKDGKPKPTPLKERRILLDKKRWFVTVVEVIELLMKKQTLDITTKCPSMTVMGLAAEFGTDFIWGEKGQWRSFTKRTDTTKILDKLWSRVKKSIIEKLTYTGPITQTPDYCIEGARVMAKLTGIDIKAIHRKVSKEKYPVPKSWAKLNEDGTQKKTKTKAKPKCKSKTKKAKNR